MPVLSNGHIAVQLKGSSVYKNGLYNGQHGLSHRARIPNYSNVMIAADDRQLSNRSSSTTSYRMNYRHGIFETLIQVGNVLTIRHQVYVHRYYTRAIVNEISLTRIGNDSDPITVAVHQDPGDEESDDIKFESKKASYWNVPGEKSDDKISSRCGTTREMEAPANDHPQQSSKAKESGLERVCVVWNHVPEEITLEGSHQSASYKFIMTVDRDLLVAEQEMSTGTCT